MMPCREHWLMLKSAIQLAAELSHFADVIPVPFF